VSPGQPIRLELEACLQLVARRLALTRQLASPRCLNWRHALAVSVLCLWALDTQAQQFNSDNQWTAPHGVGTLVLTAGQEYSSAIAVAALFPDTEFNIGLTRFKDSPEDRTEAHYSGLFYIKRRLSENEAGNAGTSISFGTGINPSYLAAGEVTDTFQSWFATYDYTMAFRDGQITWDLMPGVMVNLDKNQEDDPAWGFTWSTRAAVYKIIPQSAIVAEVWGTTGEAYAEPSYRFGVRWESDKLIVAATYGDSFDGSGSPRFEIGLIYLTDPHRILCLGGGCKK
jgi:hypothetical protein